MNKALLAWIDGHKAFTTDPDAKIVTTPDGQSRLRVWIPYSKTEGFWGDDRVSEAGARRLLGY